MKKKIMTMAMMALAFTACTEEDLMPPTQGDAGTLHITSVTIDGQQVARTRVVADGGTYDGTYPFNQSYNGFTTSDVLQLVTNGLSAEGVTTNQFYAIYNADGTWTISDTQTGTNPVSLQPTDTWANASIEAAAFGGGELSGTSDNYSSKSQGMGIVQGDIPKESSIIYSDCLVADKSNGSITIDTDVKSPTLGAVTIKLKHAHALLRLPQSAADVTPGTYIVDGMAHNVTSLGTLWAVLNMSSTSEGEDETSTTIYSPLTEVTIDGADYLQAIVPADNEGDYTLTGFKAVMNVSGSSESSATLTLDLPFKVGTENSSPESGEVPQAEGYALQPNYRYPLTLNIAPHTASVRLSSELYKPGWGTDEEELSNAQNEDNAVEGN